MWLPTMQPFWLLGDLGDMAMSKKNKYLIKKTVIHLFLIETKEFFSKIAKSFYPFISSCPHISFFFKMLSYKQ
jgi:uncharacterized membrane protein YkgB